MGRVTCPHCGAENRPSPILTTCTACGRPLDEARLESREPRQESVPEEPRTRTPLALSSSLGPGMPPMRACCAGMITWAVCLLALPVAIWLEARHGIVLGPILMVGGGLLALVVVLVYTLIHGAGESAYEVFIDAPASYHLGQTFTWGLTLRAKKPLVVGEVTYTLHHWEYGETSTTEGGGRTRPQEPLFEPLSVTVSGRTIPEGEEALLAATFTYPATSVPAYDSPGGGTKWVIAAKMPIEGPLPDIEQNIGLDVRPWVEAELTSGLLEDESVPAERLAAAHLERPRLKGLAGVIEDWNAARGGALAGITQSVLEDCGVRATVEAADGASRDGAPVMAVGASRRLMLHVTADEALECRRIECTVGSPGRGWMGPQDVVPPQTLHEGPLEAGWSTEHELEVTIPEAGPVTFWGTRVTLAWGVKVRFDMPLAIDKYLWLPIIVTPRRQPRCEAVDGQREHSQGEPA